MEGGNSHFPGFCILWAICFAGQGIRRRHRQPRGPAPFQGEPGIIIIIKEIYGHTEEQGGDDCHNGVTFPTGDTIPGNNPLGPSTAGMGGGSLAGAGGASSWGSPPVAGGCVTGGAIPGFEHII